MVSAVEEVTSTTRTAICWSSGLTEKKLIMFGPAGTVVTSTALPGKTSLRILVSPSRKYTSELLALTGGGATNPSCCGEQNWVDAGATSTVAARLPSGLISINAPAERMRP